MSDYVEVAAGIGRRICEQAFWHDGRCNWVGALPDENAYGQRSSTTRRWVPTCTAARAASGSSSRSYTP
jgi:hypothetical protein